MKNTDAAYRFKVEMSDEDRGEVLREHLMAAERRWKEATGTDHCYFGVQAAAYYIDWLMLLAPDQTRAFLDAAMAVHASLDTPTYQEASADLQAAKMCLNVELRLISEATARSHGQSQPKERDQ